MIKKKRCLIVADGFYEWEKNEKVKQPYRLVLKENPIFTFAGLWDKWNDSSGNLILTFTIITTQANELMAGIHYRMPVILNARDAKKWLNLSHDTTELSKLLLPLPFRQNACLSGFHSSKFSTKQFTNAN